MSTRLLSPLLLAAGTGLAAWAGYGAGLGRADGAGLAHWLQVLAAAVGAFVVGGVGLWRLAPKASSAPSFAAEFRALERLVPTLRRHPEGLTALQDLIDVLFEACHGGEAGGARLQRAAKGDRSHA